MNCKFHLFETESHAALAGLSLAVPLRRALHVWSSQVLELHPCTTMPEVKFIFIWGVLKIKLGVLHVLGKSTELHLLLIGKLLK